MGSIKLGSNHAACQSGYCSMPLLYELVIA
jgi:hypothetical protein